MNSPTKILWEILSSTADGTIVSVCATEAATAEEAKANTARFCSMMDCTVVGVRKSNAEELARVAAGRQKKD